MSAPSLDQRLEEWDAEHAGESRRRVLATPASMYKPRPVRWLWEGRLALGTIGLCAGREGTGKSTQAYWLAARVTRGDLPGDMHGKPRAVLVCATEDSWEHTIVPRLMAAGADLDKVFAIDVVNEIDVHVGLNVFRDLLALRDRALELGAGLLILDPIISRLGDLDTHRDSEVRQALEPLARLADEVGMSVYGLIHHNKGGSGDPLQAVMGSKAFTAVARSVHTVVPDPDDENRRLFGTPKNNLGRDNLPTLVFTVETHIIPTPEGDAYTGKLVWQGEHDGTIRDAMRQAHDAERDPTAADEAAGWLEDFLTLNGRTESAKVKTAAQKAGHTDRAIRTARQKLKVKTPSEGFPRITYWELPQS